MKNWSAGYELLRLYVRFAFWLTHKSIIVTGSKNLPYNQPTIFAPNHQNALMDPLALVCTNRFQTTWLARADIFKSKAVQPLFRYLKLLPVYRIRDGKDNLSNNEQIFSQVIGLLGNRQSVALFPEAAHSGRRQMLPHKKAIPRIALEAEERNHFNLGLQIVPVGIYYDHYWLFNRTLIVQYGTPIPVGRFQEKYLENPSKAMLSLRDEIHDKLALLVLEIESVEYYDQFENFRRLAGDSYAQSHRFSKRKALQKFLSDREFVGKLETLENEDPITFKHLLEEQTRYFEALSSLSLGDDEVNIAGETRLPKLIYRFFKAIFSLPVFIFGFLFNALPFYIPRIILKRKVTDRTFLSTFNFVAGLIAFPVFYLIEAGLIYVLSENFRLSLFLFFSFPFAGKIAYPLLQFYQKIIIGAGCLFGTKGFRNKIKQALKLRNNLVAELLASVSKKQQPDDLPEI